MRHNTTPRMRALDKLLIAPVPLLEAADLPDDDTWALPGDIAIDDIGDEDRFATLALSRSFDD